MSLNVELRELDEAGKQIRRSSFLRGSHEFDRAVERLHPRTYRIQGEWLAKDKRDNLDQLNELLKPPHNLSLEEAVKRTWTGQQAARNGFKDARVAYYVGDADAGEIDEIVVYYMKPGENHLQGTRVQTGDARYLSVDAQNNHFISRATLGDDGTVDWQMRRTRRQGGQGPEASQVLFDENELRNIRARFGDRMKRIRIKIDGSRPEDLAVLNKLGRNLRPEDVLGTPIGDLLVNGYKYGRVRIRNAQGTPPNLRSFELIAE